MEKTAATEKLSRPSPDSSAVGYAAVELMLALQHPKFPATHKVPWPVRRLLPDPLRDWDRLTHADIPTMSRDDCRREAFRFRVALAQVDHLDAVCWWTFDRLQLLEAGPATSAAQHERSVAPAVPPHRVAPSSAPRAQRLVLG